MCFESHASCGHCRGSEPGWGALRDGFVQGCWDAGSITLKGNNGTKPLEKCACWTSEKESPGQVVGLFSVSSCDGCLCNLLRQVAWPMVAAAVLGGGGRLKTHISATTSHSRNRGANQQVRAQEWAGPPEVPRPHTCPDPFPSCSELWDRGEEWGGRGDFVPPLWTPGYVQGLCTVKVLKQYLNSAPRALPAAPFVTLNGLLQGVMWAPMWAWWPVGLRS